MSRWIYRMMLFLLPKDFRRECGGDLERLFAERMDRASGRLAVMLVMLHAMFDVTGVALAEWFSPSVPAARTASTWQRAIRRRIADVGLDVRFALRVLGRNAGFTAAVVLTLGLGFGAVTGLFTVVDGVVLRPLPYPSAGRLAVLNSPYLTPDNYTQWQAEQRVAERVAPFSLGTATVLTPGGAAAVRTLPVGQGLLDLVGYLPAAGRSFTPGDHTPAAPRVVMVSESFVHRWFGGAAPVGRTLELDGDIYEIVGVLRQDGLLRYRRLDVWLPIEQAKIRGVSFLTRMPAGVTPQEAQRRLGPLADRFATVDRRRSVEQEGGSAVQVTSVRDTVLLGFDGTLWTMFAAGGALLLLALVNVASLLLGRAVDRHEEMTVRMALGAGRGRLVRQLLLEASLLAAMGAALGLLLARVTPLLIGIAPDILPRSGNIIRVNGRTLLFAIGSACFAVAVIGILPGLAAGRAADAARLRAGSGGTDRGSTRVQTGLAVFQVAAALALVVGTALLVRTYVAVRPTEPGFIVPNRATLELNLPADRYADADKQRMFVDRLTVELGRVDGVRGAAVTTGLPLANGAFMWAPVQAVDAAPLDGDRPLNIHIRAVSAGYHQLMGMPIMAGRGLGLADRAGAPRVVVINQRAATRLWGQGAVPIGRTLTVPVGDETVTATVVGVVHDAWLFQGPTPRPVAFFAFAQIPFRHFAVVLATTARHPPSEAALRTAIGAVDPRVPTQQYQTLSEAIGWSAALPRFQAALFSILGVIALVLAAMGCFAVLSRLVLRRRAELGIRMALGACRSDIVRLVLSRAALVAAAGLALGATLAWAGTRALRGYLYGVTPTDPGSFVAAALVLLCTIALAAIRPAWRAARTDPVRTLRNE